MTALNSTWNSKLFSYLFSGRWDRSTLCAGHQRYGQF